MGWQVASVVAWWCARVVIAYSLSELGRGGGSTSLTGSMAHVWAPGEACWAGMRERETIETCLGLRVPRHKSGMSCLMDQRFDCDQLKSRATSGPVRAACR